MEISSYQRLIASDYKPTQPLQERIARAQSLLMLSADGPPAGIVSDGDPTQLFAEIMVNGQSVAKIYNGGSVESSNALGGRINARVKDDVGNGPILAAGRAERLAAMLGGKVEKADTAMEQGEWQEWKLDRDQSLASYYNATPTHIAAQNISSSDEGESFEGSLTSAPSAADEFRDFMKKSVVERMVDQILKSLGISAEELAAMPSEKRASVMAKIQEIIEEKLRQTTGIADSSAAVESIS